jgi:hypothetical protein
MQWYLNNVFNALPLGNPNYNIISGLYTALASNANIYIYDSEFITTPAYARIEFGFVTSIHKYKLETRAVGPVPDGKLIFTMDGDGKGTYSNPITDSIANAYLSYYLPVTVTSSHWHLFVDEVNAFIAVVITATDVADKDSWIFGGGKVGLGVVGFGSSSQVDGERLATPSGMFYYGNAYNDVDRRNSRQAFYGHTWGWFIPNSDPTYFGLLHPNVASIDYLPFRQTIAAFQYMPSKAIGVLPMISYTVDNLGLALTGDVLTDGSQVLLIENGSTPLWVMGLSWQLGSPVLLF